MDISKADEVKKLLDTFLEVSDKIQRLNNILGTDRGNDSKRNIAGFLVSPTLYYSIYEQIKSEYLAHYNELEPQIKSL